METISVVIPVRNGERTLAICLASVLDQSYPAREIIVVDNNSTDGTKSIIAALRKQDARVRYVCEKRIGRGAARACGARCATGHIIAITDADCTVPHHWLETITQPIRAKNEAVVQGSWQASNHGYWPRNLQQADDQFLNQQAYGQYIDHLSTRNLAMTNSLLRTFPFNPELPAAEDLDLYLRIRKTTPIRFLPTCQIATLHNHASNKIIATQYTRGYWWARVYSTYQSSGDVQSLPHFAAMHRRNTCLFPLRIWSHFIKKPFGEACFTLVTEIPWRLGIMHHFLQRWLHRRR